MGFRCIDLRRTNYAEISLMLDGTRTDRYETVTASFEEASAMDIEPVEYSSGKVASFRVQLVQKIQNQRGSNLNSEPAANKTF